jgi:uncharacterized protein YqgC (DUF456 family)
MSEFLHYLQPVLSGIVYVVMALLCTAAMLLSCVTLSGTWLVLLAAILALLLPEKAFPGIWTIACFALIAAGVEATEAVAGAWGVRKRGGSKLAGVLAVVGGLIGLVLGSFIPVLILGNLIGMITVSFVLVYVVEKKRLQKSGEAANVAWGTVLGRVFVLLLKVIATLGMITYLWYGLLRH